MYNVSFMRQNAKYKTDIGKCSFKKRIQHQPQSIINTQHKEKTNLRGFAFIHTIVDPIFLLLLPITLAMKVKKQVQKRGIENSVEAPTPNPGAPGSVKMQIQHPTRNRKTEHELHDLAVRHHPFPLGSDPNRTQQIVPVHQHVHRRIGHERHRKQRLRSL